MSTKKSYSVFIAEDMMPSLDLLINYISTRTDLMLMDTATNGSEAFNKLISNNYDLLFLDVQLPSMSGIELLGNLEKNPYVIFTTSYDQYAVKAFELGAIDYLLKPFSIERFNSAVEKFITKQCVKSKSLAFPKNYCLSFRVNKKYWLIAFHDIYYISSHGKHTIIHTEDQDFEVPKIMKDIELKLPEEQFMRIHKQYIVNTQYISRIQNSCQGRYIAIINDDDDSILPVGRSFLSSLKHRFRIDQ